ncbi:unnamed protein product [Cuscuta campestris]|uniref:Reverse transcriptase domain-containing protein n=1 Tax=Cuscuta campestris TaxID=132261 RepID=A0A484LWV7_9ASTE|nr:unnamed protein product [Cuscuta campestris]
MEKQLSPTTTEKDIPADTSTEEVSQISEPTEANELDLNKEGKKTYAEVVGIQEDLNLDLKFIPTEMINGQSIVRLTQEDIVDPGTYWNSVLICCILGANPPLDVIKGFLSRIWSSYEIEGISFLKESQFIVKFRKEEDRNEIIKRKYYYMDNKPVLVKEWFPGSKIDLMELKDVPIWIQFPDLDLKYWSLSGLIKFGRCKDNLLKGTKQLLLEGNGLSHASKLHSKRKTDNKVASNAKRMVWRPKTKTVMDDQENITREGETLTPIPAEQPVVCNEEIGERSKDDETYDMAVEGFTKVNKRKALRRSSLEGKESNYIVAEVWDQTHEGFPMNQVVQKLKQLKHPLKKLNKSKSHSLETQIEETRAKLHDIQEHLKGDRADNDMIDMEKHLKKEPHLKLRASFLMKSQQAKVDWITLGDQNSKLFYAWVKKRKLQNHITSLTNANGIEKEGKEKVAEILVEYAKKQLGTSIETESINKDIVELGNKLSIEQQLILISHVTPEEFKSCIFEIPNNKSPGPDGYSSGFFKNQWSKVGELTTRAIMSFFQKDDTLKQINATNLIFIPKKEEPKSPVDLRPIACCNVLYKTISKIFCRRLKKILPSIVSLNQGAFIEGRELVHNVLLCQEFARGYNRKNISPRCLMKLDLQKAYDNSTTSGTVPKNLMHASTGRKSYAQERYQERCDNAIASTNKYKRDNVDVTSPEAIFLLQPLYEQGLIPNMRRFDIEPYLNVSAFCMYLLSNVEASLIRVVLSINEFISKSHSLKKLNKSKSHSLETQIEETRAKLHDIQEHLKGDRADNDMIDMEKHLKKEPHLKLRASFLMKSQQAKVDWITLGDQNSKLFYAWVKKRKLQNHITSLTNANGIEKEGKEKVAEILVEYAKKQLGTSIETESINKDIVELGNKLSIEQQLILISHVTPEEFKSCIFEIPNNKSPGPDGYSSGFFKNQWSKVGELTTRAIMSFFQKDDTLKQINATNLIFIPKKEEPKSPKAQEDSAKYCQLKPRGLH